MYGELFEGIKFDFRDLGQPMRNIIFERMAEKGLDPYPDDKTKIGAWRSKNLASYVKTCKARMALVRGYRHAGERVLLDEPTLLLVLGEGEKAKGGGTRFPDGQSLMWTIDYPTVRCDIEGGTPLDLLSESEMELADELDAEFEGELGGFAGVDSGVLIESDEGEVYFIPGDLDQFEVVDESEKFELLLSPFELEGKFKVSVASVSDPKNRAAFRNRAQFRNRACSGTVPCSGTVHSFAIARHSATVRSSAIAPRSGTVHNFAIA